MTIWSYIKDKSIYITLHMLAYLIVGIILAFLGVNRLGIAMVLFIMVAINSIYLFYEIYRRYTFYKDLDKHLDQLDQKFLIAELIAEPNFFEGQFFMEALRLTGKSMNDEIGKYKISSDDYKEYIETWVHEIKTPLAASKLIIENNENEVTLSLAEELSKVDEFVEQALFYARSHHLERDYNIKSVELKQLIQAVLKRYAKTLIALNAMIEMHHLNIEVQTDAKWMVFVLTQIISNSIKYRSDDLKLVISAEDFETYVLLKIEDNGLGIDPKDLSNVFEKGYVGINGRKDEHSTGIGLYLCKTLCEKMGLNISMHSVNNVGTTIEIIFPRYKQ